MPETAIAAFMVVMGLGIAGIWTMDIVRGSRVDRADGVLRARTSDGSLLLPHWVGEYGTSAALLVGAAGLLGSASWAVPVSAASLGATWYTSTNSLGWALADSSRRAYAVPMGIGLVGSLIGLVALAA